MTAVAPRHLENAHMLKRILNAFRTAANDPHQMRAWAMPCGCIGAIVLAIAAAMAVPWIGSLLHRYQ